MIHTEVCFDIIVGLLVWKSKSLVISTQPSFCVFFYNCGTACLQVEVSCDIYTAIILGSLCLSPFLFFPHTQMHCIIWPLYLYFYPFIVVPMCHKWWFGFLFYKKNIFNSFIIIGFDFICFPLWYVEKGRRAVLLPLTMTMSAHSVSNLDLFFIICVYDISVEFRVTFFSSGRFIKLWSH